MRKNRVTGWLQKVVKLHDEIIEIYGGARGLIDIGRLESSLTRPFTGTAAGEEFFPTEIEKAAALFEGIISFHPFVDGNKRTAAIFTFEFLKEYGYKIEVDPKEIIIFSTGVATGDIRFNEIKNWFKKITRKN